MVTPFTMIECMIKGYDHSRRKWGEGSGVSKGWRQTVLGAGLGAYQHAFSAI